MNGQGHPSYPVQRSLCSVVPEGPRGHLSRKVLGGPGGVGWEVRSLASGHRPLDCVVPLFLDETEVVLLRRVGEGRGRGGEVPTYAPPLRRGQTSLSDGVDPVSPLSPSLLGDPPPVTSTPRVGRWARPHPVSTVRLVLPEGWPRTPTTWPRGAGPDPFRRYFSVSRVPRLGRPVCPRATVSEGRTPRDTTQNVGKVLQFRAGRESLRPGPVTVGVLHRTTRATVVPVQGLRRASPRGRRLRPDVHVPTKTERRESLSEVGLAPRERSCAVPPGHSGYFWCRLRSAQ